MIEFQDIIEFFVQAVELLKRGKIELCSPLEEIVLKSVADKLAYIDDRKMALNCGFDVWRNIDKELLKERGISKRVLYSRSNQFPDFIFKTRKANNRLICGSLLELKNSKGGYVASFNSTLPTKYKNLEEVDLVNGKRFVSKITSIFDGKLSKHEDYYKFPRRCFYLVRTYDCNPEKVKVSIVDGSFFETVPREYLIYQMFLQVLHEHIKKKKLEIPSEVLREVEDVLSHITDQTIIAASRIIERASVRPRLRIMAEVHSEGNPHSSEHYPEISERSFNLILKLTRETKKLERKLLKRLPELRAFTINHKRNGKYIVFQY